MLSDPIDVSPQSRLRITLALGPDNPGYAVSLKRMSDTEIFYILNNETRTKGLALIKREIKRRGYGKAKKKQHK